MRSISRCTRWMTVKARRIYEDMYETIKHQAIWSSLGGQWSQQQQVGPDLSQQTTFPVTDL